MPPDGTETAVFAAREPESPANSTPAISAAGFGSGETAKAFSTGFATSSLAFFASGCGSVVGLSCFPFCLLPVCIAPTRLWAGCA